jgi:DmsA/YnfE family anaerobic dimethyl sulfoxide reductase A subunit
MTNELASGVSRRTFIKGSALAALAAAAGTNGMFGAAPASAKESSSDADQPGYDPEREDGDVVWNTCVFCGFTRCPMRFHVKDGIYQYTEADNTGSSEFGGIQARACLRGRTQALKLNHPDRIKYPMKRTGARGSGEFERISWDEAIDTIASEYQRVIDTWGNEAVLANYNFSHLINITGGCLSSYGTDSSGAILRYVPYTNGGGTGGSDDAFIGGGIMGSLPTVMLDSDLIVAFSAGDAENRTGGGGSMYQLEQAREKGIRVVIIDPRMGDTLAAHPDEWIPIRPGTDGAMAQGMVYTMIDEGLADEDFLHNYTVGYDEQTMPDELKGQHKSYKDYVMGTGYDMVPKTPEWASQICGVPAETIAQLARDVCNANAAFVTTTQSPQRRQNGEMTAFSVQMVAFVSGQVGKPGTNNGMKTSVMGSWYNTGYLPYDMACPTPNPVTAQFPQARIIEVCDNAVGMDQEHDAIMGVDKLTVPVKFLVFKHASNMETATDVNYARKVLGDESKVEFILGCGQFMNLSLSYSDILLPDATDLELPVNIMPSMSDGTFYGLSFGSQVQEPQFEIRNEFDWVSDWAEKLGVRDEYTMGCKDYTELSKYLYEQTISSTPQQFDMPTFEEGLAQGWWMWENDEKYVAYQDWRNDPETYPMKTETGKFNIYCEGMAEEAEKRVFDDPHDIISPIPIYQPENEGAEERNDTYPLQFTSWAPYNSFHTTSNCIDIIRQAMVRCLWINPVDAEERGIENGDTVRVYNDRGISELPARVTPRIMAGVVGMGRGGTPDFDENGVDHGACANVLTSRHFSSFARGHCGNGSCLVQVEKA